MRENQTSKADGVPPGFMKPFSFWRLLGGLSEAAMDKWQTSRGVWHETGNDWEIWLPSGDCVAAFDHLDSTWSSKRVYSRSESSDTCKRPPVPEDERQDVERVRQLLFERNPVLDVSPAPEVLHLGRFRRARGKGAADRGEGVVRAVIYRQSKACGASCDGGMFSLDDDLRINNMYPLLLRVCDTRHLVWDQSCLEMCERLLQVSVRTSSGRYWVVRQLGASMLFSLSDRLIELEQTHFRRFLVNAMTAGELHVHSTGTPMWRRLTLHLSQQPAARSQPRAAISQPAAILATVTFPKRGVTGST